MCIDVLMDTVDVCMCVYGRVYGCAWMCIDALMDVRGCVYVCVWTCVWMCVDVY